jgi:hypothetical protein
VPRVSGHHTYSSWCCIPRQVRLQHHEYDLHGHCPCGSLGSPQRALPTGTKVESGTSQRKSGTSVHLVNVGNCCWVLFRPAIARRSRLFHPRPYVGVSQKSISKRPCRFLAINPHKMAPRTSQGLQERAWDAPTQGLLWRSSEEASSEEANPANPILNHTTS